MSKALSKTVRSRHDAQPPLRSSAVGDWPGTECLSGVSGSSLHSQQAMRLLCDARESGRQIQPWPPCKARVPATEQPDPSLIHGRGAVYEPSGVSLRTRLIRLFLETRLRRSSAVDEATPAA